MAARTHLELTIQDHGPHGPRSGLTCHYRCASACFHPMPNTSDNPEMHTEIAKVVSRRAVLSAAGAGGALIALGVGGTASPAAARGTGLRQAVTGSADLGKVAFAPVAPGITDDIVVPPGFRSEVLIRWGDPVTRHAPPFDVHRQSPEAAAQQFGYNNDYVGVLPLRGDSALLVVNHEYTDEQLMFPAGEYDEDTIKRIAKASHGMAVVEIRRGSRPGSWVTRDTGRSRYNRRITADTPFRMSGPAAGDPRLRTSADPSGRVVLGTLGNCAGGTTPWGTVLSGEENFNGYFDRSGDLDPRYAASYSRYGLKGSGRGWQSVDSRFDLTQEPHEPYRFGWIVEIDPFDPTSTPRKHSMLGRFKHEGANVTIATSGHAVAYLGDDERGDYLYKFVSSDRFHRGRGERDRKKNLQLLTKGTLYVARLTGDGTEDGTFDGTGEWIALTSDTESFVPGMSVADVLIDTRLAADTVAPTKMDRPEDVEPNPVNGKVYCALTNNSDRGVKYAADEANPLTTSMVRSSFQGPLTPKSGNRNGYVLELTEDGDDHTATTFTWDLMLVCGDPEAPESYFAGFPKEQVSPISCPDNVAFDAEGNLWISTDGNVLGFHDGLFRVPVAGPDRGKVEQFLSVPIGAECSGPVITDDQRSVFVAVQHPGETDDATFEAPSSTWPHSDEFPRPSVVVAYAG